MRPYRAYLNAIAVCFGVACGADTQGTGPVHVDSGVGDDSGRTSDGAGDAASGSQAGMSKGAADSATGDASSGGTEGGGTTGDGGGTAADVGGGQVAAQDAATSDAVAVLLPDGGTICGQCPQGQQCDPTLGCVDCTMDSQCPASTRFCVRGSCVQCRTSTDCSGTTTPSCYPTNHTCGAACTSNQECQQQDNGTPICDMSTGACVGCATAADCPASQRVCDPTTQQCVQCASSADCAGTSTPYCTSGGGNPSQCVQCLQDAHCPSSMPSCNGGTCQTSHG